MLSAPIMSRFDLFFILVDECNEIVDYAIARRIVDLHTNAIQTTVEQVYQREDVLRYISFARQFKPLITKESMKLLVENYGHLRQRDVGSGGKSTWRITVRQLESMIRLSEAMAKMECSGEVLPKHVNEAYRLLNKSIIRVEQPDIHLGEEEHAGAMEVDENVPDNGQAGENPEETQVVTKKTFSLTFDEYKNLSNMLILYLREEEAKCVAQGTDTEGIKKSALVEWYLEQIQEMLETEEDLIERKLLVERLVDRLITHDQVLIPLRTGDLKQKGVDQEMEEDDPLLMVHPNYVVDK